MKSESMQWCILSMSCLATAFSGLPAMGASVQEQQLEVLDDDAVPQEYGLRAGSVIAAPIPFSNPTIGSGLALGAAWLFSADPGSDSSSVGLGGFKSDNGSFALGVGVDLNFLADRYQLSFLAAQADLTYAYTAGPVDFDIDQDGELYRLDLRYGFSETFSAGLGVRYLSSALVPDLGLGIDLPDVVAEALDVEILKYGALLDWDWRDDEYFPRDGGQVTLDALHGDVISGVLSDYDKAVLSFDAFGGGFTDDDAVAASVTVCGSTDTAPFFDSCGIGLPDGFRGFSVTEFIAPHSLSLQGEYRGRIGESRFGYVAFGGLGVVADGFGDLLDEDPHVAGGVGARFRLSRSYPVDFSIDVARNDQGEESYYIYVGQAF
jgi:hypothetical protein